MYNRVLAAGVLILKKAKTNHHFIHLKFIYLFTYLLRHCCSPVEIKGILFLKELFPCFIIFLCLFLVRGQLW